MQTFLRVHAIPGIMDFYDYSAAAIGMQYPSSNNPGGVVIDGVPDAMATAAPTWEAVTGTPGTMVSVSTVPDRHRRAGLQALLQRRLDARPPRSAPATPSSTEPAARTITRPSPTPTGRHRCLQHLHRDEVERLRAAGGSPEHRLPRRQPGYPAHDAAVAGLARPGADYASWPSGTTRPWASTLGAVGWCRSGRWGPWWATARSS